jgi:hypothetical protein
MSQGTIKRQVVVEGNQIAFEAGETVEIESTQPNPQNPTFKYVVLSQRLQKRFQLSDDDIQLSLEQAPVVPPASSTQPIYQQPVTPQSLPTPKKPGGKGKWILLGAGILVVLIIIVAVASGGKKSEKTETKSSTPTGTSSETKKDTYAVGETAKDGDLSITVYSFTPSPGDAFSKPEAGNQFIVVDLGIDNNGTDKANLSTMMEMSIRTPEGRKYDQAAYFPEPKYPDGAIQPSGKARGNVAFEVPANIGSMEFVFESLTGDPVRFKFQ